MKSSPSSQARLLGLPAAAPVPPWEASFLPLCIIYQLRLESQLPFSHVALEPVTSTKPQFSHL